jgi:hypothetical protein
VIKRFENKLTVFEESGRKNVKTSKSKFQTIGIKPLLKLQNTYNKPCFETTYLGKLVKKYVRKKYPKMVPILWLHFAKKDSLWPLKSSQNDVILPNLRRYF